MQTEVEKASADYWAVNRANALRIAHGSLPSGEVIPVTDPRWMECRFCVEPGEIDTEEARFLLAEIETQAILSATESLR